MANETEVDRLVVRLVGDASEYQNVLNQAVADTAASVRAIQNQASEAQAQHEAIMNAARQVASEMGNMPHPEAVQHWTKQQTELVELLSEGAVEARTYTEATDLMAQALDRVVQQHNALIVAEQQEIRLRAEAARITQAAVTPEEAYRKALEQLNQHLNAGRISQETYNRTVIQMTNSLPAVRAAQEAHNKALADAERITKAVITAQERHAQTLSTLKGHLDEHRISQETYQRAVAASNRELANSRSELSQWGSQLSQIGFTMTLVGGIVSGVFGSMVTMATHSAGVFEQTTISFETLLGSAVEAQQMLARLTDFAAKTPYEMPEVEKAARGLALFGERGDQLMETLQILGNAASGTNTQFGMVALIFNQIRGVGRLLTQDFRQLSTRGILSLRDLANHFGVVDEEAQRMLSNGKITFEDVREVFKSLSAEGGRFANLMERQSMSLLGRISTLKDSFNIMLREIGTNIAPVMSTIVTWTIKAVDVLREANPAIHTTAAVVGVLTTAAGAVTVALGGTVIVAGQLITAYTTLAAAATTSAAAQYVLTGGLLAAKAAAIGLAGLGIAGVSFAIYSGSAAIRDYNAALAESAKLSDQLSALESKRRNEIIQSAQAMAVGSYRRNFLESELGTAKTMMAGIERQLSGTKQRVDDLAPSWMSLWQWGKKVHQSEMEALTATQGRYDQAKNFVRQLQGELEKLDKAQTRGGQATPEAVKSAEDYLETLKMQAQTFGMTAREAKIYELQLAQVSEETIKAIQLADKRLTLMEEMRAETEAQAKAEEELEKAIRKKNDAEQEAQARDAQKLQADIDSLTDSFIKQSETVGMTANQIKLWELAQRGATDQQLLMASVLADANDAAAKQAKLMDQGKQLTEKYLDPQGKFIAEMAKLNELLNAGAINQAVYTQALDEAKQEMIDAQSKANINLTFTAGPLDPIRKGTKEFYDLLENRDRILSEQKLKDAADKLAAAGGVVAPPPVEFDKIGKGLAIPEPIRFDQVIKDVKLPEPVNFEPFRPNVAVPEPDIARRHANRIAAEDLLAATAPEEKPEPTVKEPLDNSEVVQKLIDIADILLKQPVGEPIVLNPLGAG